MVYNIYKKNYLPTIFLQSYLKCKYIYNKNKWVIKILENINSPIKNSVDNTEIINNLLKICQ